MTAHVDTSFGYWVEHTRLWQLSKMIRREVDAHKYYESEKAGHDIGWDRARVDWMLKYGHQFMKTHA